MEDKKYASYLATLSVTLSAGLIPFSLEVPQLNAQPLYVSIGFPPTSVGKPRTSIGGGVREFEPPPVGAPQPSVGGGVREFERPIRRQRAAPPLSDQVESTRARPTQASCFNKDSHITVLSPQNNVVTTVSAQPTLFWYIPKTQVKTADFVVYQRGQIVYQTQLALKGTPGVVQLSLPPTVALETGREYNWKLVFNCNPTGESGNTEMVEGEIKRTVLTSTQKSQLAAAKQPLKQAEVYAKAGVWQETINILAQLRRDRPSDRDVNAAWKELLESVDLKNIASEPLVECCRADK